MSIEQGMLTKRKYALRRLRAFGSQGARQGLRGGEMVIGRDEGRGSFVFGERRKHS